MHVTDEQKKLLKLLYITYGRTIPFQFSGLGNIEKWVYGGNVDWGGWWVASFGPIWEDNDYLTYASREDWRIPVTVTDKFIELVMEE